MGLVLAYNNCISIHALLAESDRGSRKRHTGVCDFYPRSPCGERQVGFVHAHLVEVFLSTLSLRRATSRRHQTGPGGRNFYPRSPCGERPAKQLGLGVCQAISIHALLAESDIWTGCDLVQRFLFLSTLSLRRATVNHAVAVARRGVFLSTLSLRRATI